MEELKVDKILIMTVVGSEQQAIEIAHALVQEKLAACVSYSMRFHSIYRWQGKVCKDQEVLMLIKSKKERESDIMDMISKMHEYEVPEIFSFTIQRGADKYMKWIDDVVK